jgi:hypothetical protein
VTAHYDSVALIRKPFTGDEQRIAESVRQGVDENEARHVKQLRTALGRGQLWDAMPAAIENYKNQHSTTDTLTNTSIRYATRVARMNAAVLASLALSPAPPGLNWACSSGPNKGGHVPLLTRGKSGYDAVLHWLPNTDPDLAGYAVVMRSTTSPAWERETWVGNVTSYTMSDVSIDDVIGVKAVDADGNQSVVSPYMEPVPPATLTRPQPSSNSAEK